LPFYIAKPGILGYYMDMEIIRWENKDALQDFLTRYSLVGSEFLLSFYWLEIAGDPQYSQPFLVSDKQGEAIATFSIMPKSTIFGWKYAYLPRGPILKSDLSPEKISEVLSSIRDFLKNEGFCFWRLEPSLALPPGFAASKIMSIQPQRTITISLSRDMDDIAASFHQKSRYNVRLAAKKGVSVRVGQNEEDFASFWKLMEETKDRDGFRIHDRKHYHRLFFANKDFIVPLLAEHEGKNIAAGLFCFYGNRGTYLHGATSNCDRQFMAPYLLQWEAMKLAREHGCLIYDFYGIDKQRWPGVTRFKRGFGGQELEYPGTFEQGICKLPYAVFTILKKVRKII
jgi:lipid II:glycine glycyltransferase (peptidoglycan interpeptide bridge formation enzyme)